MNRAKFNAIAALCLVFLAGAAAGGLAMKLHEGRRIQALTASSEGPSARMAPYLVRRLTRDLDLTPDQRRRVDTIARDFAEDLAAFRQRYQPEFRQLMDGCVHDIKTVLTPDQARRMEDLHEDLRRRWAKGDPSGCGEHHGGFRRMMDSLGLTEEQATRLRPVLMNARRRMRLLLRRIDEAPPERRPGLEASLKKEVARISAETDAAAASILTPDQLIRFREAVGEFLSHRHDGSWSRAPGCEPGR